MLLPLIITAAVTGAASTAGAWAFNQIANLHHKAKELQNRVDALEQAKER